MPRNADIHDDDDVEEGHPTDDVAKLKRISLQHHHRSVIY